MNILVIDDDRNIGRSLKWLLEKEGHEVSVFHSGEEGIAGLHGQFFDVVFLDVMLPGMGGLETLSRLLERQPSLKIFMISGQADITTAVRATKLGAYDFLEKPLNPEKIILEIKKLLEQEKIKAEVNSLKKLVESEFQFLGNSPQMLELKDIIARAAPSEGRILIFGENGTGKELVSREIHKLSHRHEGAFIQLNCAALPKELIESELFGYEKGAFTGAVRRKMGLIELAEQGTLLLDEVGDMALETQAKLLRVLQENEFYRVGGTIPYKFNVRIISATNKDLRSEIAKGNFRQDLFFRLNVIPIHVPPLRDHPEDIPVLLFHFLNAYSRKNGKKVKTMTENAIQVLMKYHWPGNIRELGNIAERLAIMTTEFLIDVQDVELVLGESNTTGDENNVGKWENLSLKEQMDKVEENILLHAFHKYAGNVTHVARVLKTDRANLYKKLQKYGLKPQRS
jgi:two-component system, NtrC family, nitrogen regulation response regulator NtrX